MPGFSGTITDGTVSWTALRSWYTSAHTELQPDVTDTGKLGTDEDIRLMKEFIYLWSEFFSTTLDGTYTLLGHIRYLFFGTSKADDAWERFKNNCNCSWNGYINAINGCNDTTARLHAPYDANSWNWYGLNIEYAAGYGLFRKPDSIKDAFIRNWLFSRARGTVEDGDNTDNWNRADTRGFKFRKDDGAHKHTINDYDTSHAHNINTDRLQHTHTVDRVNVTGTITVNTPVEDSSAGYAKGDYAASNLPPYLTCYIWKRTK
jgi:hypothetical protein